MEILKDTWDTVAETKKTLQNTQRGEIRRNTLHGLGVPNEDIQVFHVKISFGRAETKWNCAMCDCTRSVYQWTQAYGHVKAQHCSKSREPNERWDIPPDMQFRDPCDLQLPENIKPMTQFDIKTNKIRLISAIPERWECVQCGEQEIVTTY